jgi:ferredoxin
MVVKSGVDFSQYEQGIKDSADECPTSVIKYEEE